MSLLAIYYILDANNPSDLIKQLRKDRERGKVIKEMQESKNVIIKQSNKDDEEDWVELSRKQLAANMKEEHGLALKDSILRNMRAEERIVVLS